MLKMEILVLEVDIRFILGLTKILYSKDDKQYFDKIFITFGFIIRQRLKTVFLTVFFLP